ncbi:MAG TPA: DUF2267 domain-containing protein [Gemmataceae bacterium]|nr:DUF2267 domain-containing protein [Gemmataceae bacterium]
MSTGFTPFDTTIQTTQVWLNELMELMAWQDRHRAYLALRAVLHTLRDRLSVDEVAALGAQLPMIVRGFYYEGWHPHGKPVPERKKDEFLAHIRAAFPQEAEWDAEEVARAVFQLLAVHVSSGEIEKMKHTLPAEIRALWAENMPLMQL